MSVDKNFSLLKSTILLFLLFVISVLLLTPYYLVTNAEEIVKNWNLKISSVTVNKYIQTYLTLFVNVVMIPFFIDMMVLLEDFETKSDR